MVNKELDNEISLQNITQINSQLAQLDNPIFSEKAYTQFREKISNYILDLINESSYLAIRRSSDSISESDIETANSFLVAHSKKRISEKLGIIGGLLFGSAFGAFLSSSESTTIYSMKLILILFIGLIGIVLIGISFVRDY